MANPHRFLNFPGEVRNLIYEYTVLQPHEIELEHVAPPPITRTCRQIRREAMYSIFSENTFRVRVNTNFCASYQLMALHPIQRARRALDDEEWKAYVNRHIHWIRRVGKIQISPRSLEWLNTLHPSVIEFRFIHFILRDVGCPREERISHGVAIRPNRRHPVDVGHFARVDMDMRGSLIVLSWSEPMVSHAYDHTFPIFFDELRDSQATCNRRMEFKIGIISVFNRMPPGLGSVNWPILKYMAETFRYTDTWTPSFYDADEQDQDEVMT